MTVNECTDKVLRLLGYVNNLGVVNDSELRSKIIEQINLVYADLWYSCKTDEEFKKVENPDDEINLPEIVLNDCFLYGVAQMVAAAEGDSDNQAYFGQIYNQKRNRCNHIDTIIDTLPHPCI